jgi:hypothetical protein
MEFRAMEGLQLEDHVRDSRYLEDPHEIQHFVDDTSIGSSWGARLNVDGTLKQEFALP